MKNIKFIAVFLVGLSALIFYAVLPDYKESQKPMNIILTKAKDVGGAAVAQFVDNQKDFDKAQRYASSLDGAMDGKIVMQVIKAEDAADFIMKNRVSVPGFIIVNVDGHTVMNRKGFLTTEAAPIIFKGIHMH